MNDISIKITRDWKKRIKVEKAPIEQEMNDS